MKDINEARAELEHAEKVLGQIRKNFDIIFNSGMDYEANIEYLDGKAKDLQNTIGMFALRISD